MDKLCIKPSFSLLILAIAALPNLACAGEEPTASEAAETEEILEVPLPRDIAAFEQIWLTEHNKERARLGLAPLVWDAKLAKNAASHAAEMAKTDVYEHADQSVTGNDQGENMWMGTVGFYDGAAMVGSWIDEAKDFEAGTFPKVSKTGNWTDIGHYTQLIWPATKAVGCALAGNPRDEYMVCRYYPAGNILGEKIGVK